MDDSRIFASAMSRCLPVLFEIGPFVGLGEFTLQSFIGGLIHPVMAPQLLPLVEKRKFLPTRLVAFRAENGVSQMFRMLMTLAGLVLEAAAFATEGFSVALLGVAGVIAGLICGVLESSPFAWVVNWLTRCDLPECPDPSVSGLAGSERNADFG